MPMRSEKWERRFQEVAEACNLKLSYKESMHLINKTLDPLRTKAYKIAKTIKQPQRNAGSLANETTRFLLDAAKSRQENIEHPEVDKTTKTDLTELKAWNKSEKKRAPKLQIDPSVSMMSETLRSGSLV